MEIALSLLLLLTANGSPIIACYMLGETAAWRVDAGRRFIDHQPLLGESKTWRGIVAAIVSSWTLALVLGYPGELGVKFAAYAMLGDLLSSFIKRRLLIPPSGRMAGLDHLPEALLPLLFLRQELGLGLAGIAMVVALFFVFDEGLSRLLYCWRIRKRPY